MNNALTIHEINCPPTCKLCVDACSQRKLGAPTVIEKIDLPEVNFHSVLTCNQCSQPVCVDVCPTGALYISSAGTILLDDEFCVGCNICNLACPYGGITSQQSEYKMAKCDLCGDDPQCAKACPDSIISYEKAGVIIERMNEDLLSPGMQLCAGCGIELLDRFTIKTLGKNIALFSAPSCNVMSSRVRTPHYGTLMTNPASIATGVSRYFQHIGKDTICVAIIGDGATADLGFGMLSGAAERGEKIIYICYDNEAYMNTGVQRSSTTPTGSWTNTTPIGSVGRGRQGTPKNVPLLMAFHGIRYVATASLAYMEDYMQKLLKAKEAVKEGFVYIHVICPCPTGWKSETERTVELTRIAVETNYFPLWENDNGVIKFTHEVQNRRPIEDYTKLMKRFSHLTEEELEQFQEYVDDSYENLRQISLATQR